MLLHCWWECKLIQPLWKMVWRFLENLGIKHHMTQQSQRLGIHPEETKIEKHTCIPLFIATLFTIVTTWKQPRCPWTDEWIKKWWYIYTMEYIRLFQFWFLQGICLGVGLLGHMVVLFLVLKESPYHLPQWLYQFTFPPAVQEGSLLSIPTPAFIVCRFFDDVHSDQGEVISY